MTEAHAQSYGRLRVRVVELVRAVAGRRTEDEIAGYGWDPAPDAQLLPAAPFFTIRSEPLGE